MKNLLTAEQIFGIEQKCFSEPWSMEMITAQLNSKNSATLIKTINGVPAGYATGLKLEGEGELYRIAVLPEHRGKGFAKELLTRFLEKCGSDVFLEVRSENKAAIALYKSAGFEQAGLRKNYYGDDDALIFRRNKCTH
ncbi:MAG: ribosomal protein S18-alanine N-acetyltransferase [Oscillospiraceae bacterium]|jgi:ribosomal-protein-alanine N-acetyltransferase|nr:ribosomal protein S18-alanine N-acetyltransferase [Oscillospiraceae bacterium]